MPPMEPMYSHSISVFVFVATVTSLAGIVIWYRTRAVFSQESDELQVAKLDRHISEELAHLREEVRATEVTGEVTTLLRKLKPPEGGFVPPNLEKEQVVEVREGSFTEALKKLQPGATGFIDLKRISGIEKRLTDVTQLFEVRKRESPKGNTPGRRSSNSGVRPWMQVVVSLAFLGASIYFILSPHFQANDKHWAYGSAGTILGFWLKN